MLAYPADPLTEAAVDEAGRGCLAFGVCAAAVVFPRIDAFDALTEEDRRDLHNIRDSKAMSEKKRENLAAFIRRFAVAHSVAVCTPEEIDKHNILNATHIAMHRALDAVHARHKFSRVIVDGDRFPPYCPPGDEMEDDCDEEGDQRALWLPHVCEPGADSRCIHVAAASILAKTHRDNIVKDYCDRDPSLDARYGFRKNKAYGTPAHLQALREHGATIHHRKSYAPVSKCIAGNHASCTRLQKNEI